MCHKSVVRFIVVVIRIISIKRLALDKVIFLSKRQVIRDCGAFKIDSLDQYN